MGLLRLVAFTWTGRAIVGLVAIAVVGSTVIAPRFAASAPTVAVRTATVARGNVAQTVTVSGSINAAGTVKLSFGTAGRLLETLVKVGDTVAKDQPLARLDTTDLQTAVRQQEANVASAQAKYDQAITGATAEDIALARNAVDAAQITYEQTKKTTQNDIATAQQALDNAKRALDDTIKTTDRDLATAQIALDNAKRSLDDSLKQSQNDLAAAQLAVDNAKKALDQAKQTNANDVAAALQTFTKLKTGYSSARSNLTTLTSGIKTDIASYQDALTAARSQVATTLLDIDLGARSSDVTSAKTSVNSADLSLSNAQSYATGTVQNAWDDLSSAIDAIVAGANSFDRAIAAGTDTGSAVSQYQTAQATYTLAASRLSTALDAPAAQVTSAQTSMSAAQTSLNTTASKNDAGLEKARGDIASLLTALTSEAQLATSIKSKVTQAGTAVSTITDAVGGSYLSAQQAATSTQTKSDSSIQNAQNTYASAQQSLTATQQKNSTSVANAQNTYANAQQSLATTQQKNGTSLSSAQNTVASAQLTLISAQDKATSSVASQEIAIKNAQVNLQKTSASPKAADIASALASLQIAQITLDKAKNDLANATLKAPNAGVVASIASQPGEFVSANTAAGFIVLALTSTLTLHGTVGEADVAKLKLGQVATATVEAIGSGTRLTGRVTGLDPVATIQQGVPVYGVDVQIDVPDAAMRAGMSGTATVIIANKQGVLTVPNLAIRSQSGRRFVQVMRDGQTQDAADVTFGIANDTLTEVTSGLHEGDVVVLPQPRTATTTQQGPGGVRIGGPGQGPVPGVPFR